MSLNPLSIYLIVMHYNHHVLCIFLSCQLFGQKRVILLGCVSIHHDMPSDRLCCWKNAIDIRDLCSSGVLHSE